MCAGAACELIVGPPTATDSVHRLSRWIESSPVPCAKIDRMARTGVNIAIEVLGRRE